jgi:hypothetical protein
VAVTVGFLCFSGTPAVAATLVVDDDRAQSPNAPFFAPNGVQDAENAGAPGDIIQVCPGNYNGVRVDTPDRTFNGSTRPVKRRVPGGE